MAAAGVTQGAIARIWNGATSADVQPVLEVRGCRPLDNARFSVHVADNINVIRGVTFIQGGFSEELKNKQAGPGTLIKVYQFEKVCTEKAQILGIHQAEVVGRLEMHERVPDAVLARLTNAQTGREVDGGIGMTQACVGDAGTGSGPSNNTYTTPERRSSVDAEATMSGQKLTAMPPPHGRAPESGLPGCGIAEAETQPDGGAGMVAAFNRAAADAPRQQNPGNPYSVGGANSMGIGLGSMGPPGTTSGAASSAAGPFGDPMSTGLAGATSASASSASRPVQSRLSQGGGGMASQAAGPTTPIGGLNMYTAGRWRIKARVLMKGDIRKFSNSRGEGQLLKVDLADQSGEISATFFGRAVDKYYGMLQPGQVYTFQKGQIKPANKRYDRGDVVLVFEEHAQIEAVNDDQSIPGMTYDFKPLCEIHNLEVETRVDVKAVIYAVQDPFTFTAKTSNREMTKREIGLWDPSGPDGFTTFELTVWGEKAVGAQYEVGAVVFAKRARVSEWNGQKALSSPEQADLNPDHPDAFALTRKFKEQQSLNLVPSRQMNRSSLGGSGMQKTLEACKQEDMHLGVGGGPGTALPGPGEPRIVHRHVVMATLTTLPTDRGPFYPSCPEQVASNRPAANAQAPPPMRTCNKKVTQESNNTWSCASGHQCQQPVFRYLCRLNVLDHSDCTEVNIYDDVARQLLGVDAQEYAPLFEAGQMGGEREAELKKLNGRAEWKKCIIRMRAQKEVWQEAERVRYSVDEAQFVPIVKQAKQLLAEVHSSLEAMSTGS
eukprot:gb/GFBE01058020.1/.p1 GENE.gb/GFBE01058020.1/~~gb/GFBE01058020.1/.p1  ORF type:complete len:775 (+),score=150.05 gb/GFBE01058020.1/:1-2325(+)